MKTFSFSLRSDRTNEAIGKVKANSRSEALKLFVKMKGLALMDFLRIFKINE